MGQDILSNDLADVRSVPKLCLLERRQMSKRGDEELAKVERLVRQHIAEGHQAFMVPVLCLADGVLNYKIQRMRDTAQQLLLQLGLEVLGMEYDAHQQKAYFQVRVPARRVPEKQCPWCAETIKVEAIVCRFCGRELVQHNSSQIPQSIEEMLPSVDVDIPALETGEVRGYCGVCQTALGIAGGARGWTCLNCGLVWQALTCPACRQNHFFTNGSACPNCGCRRIGSANWQEVLNSGIQSSDAESLSKAKAGGIISI
jgi:hypothetical protein